MPRRRSPPTICSVAGCGRQSYVRSLCRAHYTRLWRHGDVLAGRATPGEAEAWIYRHKDYSDRACLIWPFGEFQASYYPVITNNGKRLAAHRLMCELRNGPPPTEAHEAAHLCGRGHIGCVNPQHLVWKTTAENAADMLVHGTISRGERHGASRLTEADVLAIRAAKGITQMKLADHYGVHYSTIGYIRRGRLWGWLK